MGAWGEGPTDNDTALDWLDRRVETPLALTIKDTLQGYLDGRMEPAQAEAAIALLVDYSSGPGGQKYLQINLAPAAEAEGLWGLAADVLRALMADEGWMGRWISRQAKVDVLQDLLGEVEEHGRSKSLQGP
ncbi:DUF4259 domain-containing protein [Tautonia plasticadhaerens]|uniref:DUF4259 domain-containing protein n=1 Tax=Tautonia plasticadhaerens TaxID=2527974 RepID=A0A518H999_9BACT|nr:DUF4259 domain-containing protein [Tautonia plasticadhaerens]QDV37424.1 hypothetical protein ElP_53630 [Tautonia plasticadhaerens]